jgi:hypothetical protein
MRVPESVSRYLERSIPGRSPVPARVRIAQEGEMCQKPGGRATRFTAIQDYSVDRIAFSWRARFPIVGPIVIRVVDEYAAGEGRLEARLLGVPLQRQSGAATTAGEVLRYLAELPWVPFAMAHNRELEWRELDARRFEVATTVGRERLAVELELDAAGDVMRAFSSARPRLDGKRSVPTPWVGEFREYGTLGGVRVPTRAEVRWELPEGPFVYWRGTVTSLELDAPAGPSS